VKKMIAGVFVAVLMSAGLLTGTQAQAGATYGPPAAARHVVHDINAAVNKKGKLTVKRANHLKARVRLARDYGLITPATAKRLIKKINKDTRRH
jgi:hypothetical protein